MDIPKCKFTSSSGITCHYSLYSGSSSNAATLNSSKSLNHKGHGAGVLEWLTSIECTVDSTR
jgi:hypothetical protein